MSYDTRRVIVCDGVDRVQHPCGKVINEGEKYLTVQVKAWSSDIDKPRGMEGYTAMQEAGLIRTMHIHVGCECPVTVIPHLMELAAATNRLS